MKKLLILVAVLMAATFTAHAGKDFAPWAPGFVPVAPRTLAAAEACHDGGGSVALVCKDCKAVNKASDKKGLAKMFEAKATHDCAGCGGKITVHQSVSKASPQSMEYHHTCSKCAKDSTTCAMHPKG